MKEHSFTGVFTNDYPNGEGQENIIYEKADGGANRGVFNYVNGKEGYQGKRPILTVGDGFTTKEFDGCMWILPKDNKGFGIAGLMRAE